MQWWGWCWRCEEWQACRRLMPGLTQGLPGMPGPPYLLRALPLAGIPASEPGSCFLPRFLFQPPSHWLHPLLLNKKPAWCHHSLSPSIALVIGVHCNVVLTSWAEPTNIYPDWDGFNVMCCWWTKYTIITVKYKFWIMLPQIKHIADTGPHYFRKYKVSCIIFLLEPNPKQLLQWWSNLNLSDKL